MCKCNEDTNVDLNIDGKHVALISIDNLVKMPRAISISKYTNYIIKQNLIFAITVKLIVLFLSVIEIAIM